MLDQKMIDFELELDYPMTEDDLRGDPRVAGSGFKNTAQITRMLLREAVSSRFPNGIEGSDRRIWARLDRNLLKICESLTEEGVKRTIRVNEDQFQFIYESVDKWKVRPAVACWWDVLMEYLDEVKDAKKKRAEEPAA